MARSTSQLCLTPFLISLSSPSIGAAAIIDPSPLSWNNYFFGFYFFFWDFVWIFFFFYGSGSRSFAVRYGVPWRDDAVLSHTLIPIKDLQSHLFL